MRKAFAILILTMAVGTAWAQSGSTTQTAPAAKSGAPAKPSGAAKPAAAATKPTAIINTTAGKLTCTLFPDKAPIGVENFIGLANGTKDWKNPVSGATKHGVPLYMKARPICSLINLGGLLMRMPGRAPTARSFLSPK